MVAGRRRRSRSAPARSSATTSKRSEPASVATAAVASASVFAPASSGAQRGPRSQRRRERSVPAAAAEPGSKRSSGSTSAARAPARVVRARSARRTPVRPEEAGPWISESAPRGKPPSRSASTSPMPVESGRRRSSPRSGGSSAWRRRARSRSSRARFRSIRDGASVAAGREAALMAFAFSSLSMIGRRAGARQSRRPCGREAADPNPFDPVREGPRFGRGLLGEGPSGEAFEIPRAPDADGRALG